jgi:hypothetical protein
LRFDIAGRFEMRTSLTAKSHRRKNSHEGAKEAKANFFFAGFAPSGTLV